MAVIAAMAGDLAGICIIAVPTLILSVCARIQAAGVTASPPHASAVHTESNPSDSACFTISIFTCAFGPNAAPNKPNFIILSLIFCFVI